MPLTHDEYRYLRQNVERAGSIETAVEAVDRLYAFHANKTLSDEQILLTAFLEAIGEKLKRGIEG